VVHVPLSISPDERSLRGRIGAYALHSKYDSREITRAARAAYLAKWTREVDPEGVLPEDERDRRAVNALKAHMARLALKSAQARRARKAGRR
jgi:hypothetical protein